jgi:hypothetical protein
VSVPEGVASPQPAKGLPHDVPGAELHEVCRRYRRGPHPGRTRAAARSGTVEGMPREAPVRFGGANPERTTCEPPPRPETHEQEHSGQPVHGGTGRQQPGARVRILNEEVAGSNPVTPTNKRPDQSVYSLLCDQAV